jgi:hypothetical protein
MDKLSPPAIAMEDIKRVIYAMMEDIGREAEGEIKWSPAVNKAIGNETATLFKKRISK